MSCESEREREHQRRETDTCQIPLVLYSWLLAHCRTPYFISLTRLIGHDACLGAARSVHCLTLPHATVAAAANAAACCCCHTIAVSRALSPVLCSCTSSSSFTSIFHVHPPSTRGDTCHITQWKSLDVLAATAKYCRLAFYSEARRMLLAIYLAGQALVWLVGQLVAMDGHGSALQLMMTMLRLPLLLLLTTMIIMMKTIQGQAVCEIWVFNQLVDNCASDFAI